MIHSTHTYIHIWRVQRKQQGAQTLLAVFLASFKHASNKDWLSHAQSGLPVSHFLPSPVRLLFLFSFHSPLSLSPPWPFPHVMLVFSNSLQRIPFPSFSPSLETHSSNSTLIMPAFPQSSLQSQLSFSFFQSVITTTQQLRLNKHWMHSW